MGTMHLDTPCPACGAQGIIYNTATTDVPYFGDCMETLIACGACGFKHTDILILGESDPVRYSLHVNEEAALFARVVRGSSGTVRIPELGVLIEPGPISEAYVSNVEGVLARVETVLGQVTRSGTETERERATAMIERIERIRQGGEGITLILEDPFGNSAIIHPDAEKELLSAEEAGKLKTGMTVIDLQDLVDENDDDDEDEGGGLDVDDLLKP
jgi:zinc finger protein